jgi:hypothetical protein
VKGKLDEIAKVYGQMRSEMYPEPGVRLAHILAARQDLAILEKTTSASVREKTKTDINRYGVLVFYLWRKKTNSVIS